MGNYGIAFMDRHGRGFSKKEPLLIFVNKNDSIQVIKDEIAELKIMGVKI